MPHRLDHESPDHKLIRPVYRIEFLHHIAPDNGSFPNRLNRTEKTIGVQIQRTTQAGVCILISLNFHVTQSHVIPYMRQVRANLCGLDILVDCALGVCITNLPARKEMLKRQQLHGSLAIVGRPSPLPLGTRHYPISFSRH